MAKHQCSFAIQHRGFVKPRCWLTFRPSTFQEYMSSCQTITPFVLKNNCSSYDILLDTICHSDDRREEDVLLRTMSEKSVVHPRLHPPLCPRDSSLRWNDKGFKQEKRKKQTIFFSSKKPDFIEKNAIYPMLYTKKCTTNCMTFEKKFLSLRKH